MYEAPLSNRLKIICEMNFKEFEYMNKLFSYSSPYVFDQNYRLFV